MMLNATVPTNRNIVRGIAISKIDGVNYRRAQIAVPPLRLARNFAQKNANEVTGFQGSGKGGRRGRKNTTNKNRKFIKTLAANVCAVEMMTSACWKSTTLIRLKNCGPSTECTPRQYVSSYGAKKWTTSKFFVLTVTASKRGNRVGHNTAKAKQEPLL